MTTAELIDLNDYAVNTLRNYCRANGYDAGAVYAAELALIHANSLDLAGYLKFRRIGSTTRLTRAIRRAIFTVKTTRAALR